MQEENKSKQRIQSYSGCSHTLVIVTFYRGAAMITIARVDWTGLDWMSASTSVIQLCLLNSHTTVEWHEQVEECGSTAARVRVSFFHFFML